MTTDTETTGSGLREIAIGRLRKKREFSQHVAVYAVFNLMLGLIWLGLSLYMFRDMPPPRH